MTLEGKIGVAGKRELVIAQINRGDLMNNRVQPAQKCFATLGNEPLTALLMSIFLGALRLRSEVRTGEASDVGRPVFAYGIFNSLGIFGRSSFSGSMNALHIPSIHTIRHP